jgi:hypothetical protein
MSTATSTATPGISFTLSGKWLYVLLLTLIMASVIGVWVYAFIPNFLGLGALAASLTAFIGYLTHDLTDDTAAPGWATFLVIILTGAFLAAAGYFTSNPTLTWTSELAAALVFFSFLYHAVSADAGKSVNANVEAFLVGVFGVAVAVIQYLSANPNYTTVTVIVTVVTTFSVFFHVSEEDGTIAVTPTGAAPPTTA